MASIFEIPITQAIDVASGDGQDLMRWTTTHYPALRAQNRYLSEDKHDLESWRDWPPIGEVSNPGYWIAAVYSYRIPDVQITGCGCTARVPGGDPGCEWCRGRPAERKLGIQWGLHAVVMRGRDLVWDPHPRRADGVGPISSTVTWHVVDPALL